MSIADIRNPYNMNGKEVLRLCQKNWLYLPAQAAENQSHQEANPQSSCVHSAEKSRLNEMANAANSVDFTNALNAGSLDHKRRKAWALFL